MHPASNLSNSVLYVQHQIPLNVISGIWKNILEANNRFTGISSDAGVFFFFFVFITWVASILQYYQQIECSNSIQVWRNYGVIFYSIHSIFILGLIIILSTEADSWFRYSIQVSSALLVSDFLRWALLPRQPLWNDISFRFTFLHLTHSKMHYCTLTIWCKYRSMQQWPFKF